MGISANMLKAISVTVIAVISIHSSLARADYDVRVTNKTPYYLQLQLQAKAQGQTKFSSCGDMQISAGTNLTESCPSNVDNWKRKFLIVEEYSPGSRPHDCVLNLDESCKRKTGISQIKWLSGRNVESPKNGGWHDKWVIRDKGRYEITIPKNYCGDIFRTNNDLWTPATIWVDTPQERSQVKDALSCLGLNSDGSKTGPTADGNKDRFKKRVIKRELPRG